jgi:Lambda phage tail tube protein, TTP
MAETQAVPSYGATISINGTPVAEVQDISGLELSTDLEEVTHHGSPDGVEERIPTIKRLGNLSFPMNIVVTDSGQQDLWAAWEDRSEDDYVVTYQSGITATFPGYVTGFGLSAPVAGHDMGDIVITPKSAPQLAFGS